MINLIHSEWIKFRSVRSTLVALILAGVLVVGIALIVLAVQDQHLGPTHLTDLTAGVNIAVLIFGALGVQVLGQEYRFNTIRPTFTAMPRRGRVLAAKVIVVMLACAAIAFVMMAVCAVLGALFASNFTIDGLDQRAAIGIIGFSMGYSALGMGVGAIVRQPIAGILILLAEGFVVENLFLGLLPRTGDWLPFINGFQMTIRNEGRNDDTIIRSVGGGAVYFFLVVAVVWGIGAVLANRRDA